MKSKTFKEYCEYQRTKYMLFLGKEKVEKEIFEIADGFYESIFGIDNLNTLKEMITDNKNTNMINNKRKIEIEKLVNFFKDNITFESKLNHKQYEWKCNEVLNELDNIKIKDSLSFYIKDFKIRTDNLQKKYEKLVIHDYYKEQYIRLIDKSNQMDAIFIDVLDKDSGNYIDESMLDNIYFLWSINKYFYEQPKLFDDPFIRSKINYIVLKTKNGDLSTISDDDAYVLKETCNKILKKINK